MTTWWSNHLPVPNTWPRHLAAYNKHKNAFWTAQEIDYSADAEDWEKLTNDEKYFIENILAFFAGSDGIVLENLVTRFCNEIKLPEARCYYTFQAMMENIHSEVYSLLIETFIKEKKLNYLMQLKQFHVLNKKPIVLRWIMKRMFWRLVAFSVVEGTQWIILCNLVKESWCKTLGTSIDCSRWGSSYRFYIIIFKVK